MSPFSKAKMSPFEQKTTKGLENGADDDIERSRPLSGTKAHRK